MNVEWVIINNEKWKMKNKKWKSKNENLIFSDRKRREKAKQIKVFEKLRKFFYNWQHKSEIESMKEKIKGKKTISSSFVHVDIKIVFFFFLS